MTIKHELKTLLWPGLVTLLPIGLGLSLWSRLPEKLPTHWNVAGVPDQYADKLFVVVGIPLLMLIVGFGMYMALVFSQKANANPNANPKVSHLIKWLAPLLTLLLQPLSLFWGLGYQLNIGVLVVAFLGVIFIWLGNYIPKTTRNRMVGFRLPTSLNNAENWRRTNRVGGIMMVIAGVVMLIGALLGFLSNLFLIGAIIMALVLVIMIPTGYSLYLAKK